MAITKSTGNISEARVLSVFVMKGWEVCIPFGDNEPYDLVINRGNGFERVQVKTGRFRPDKGCVIFNTSSVATRRAGGTHEYRDYRGRADLFAVYCRDFDSVYLVPVDDAGLRGCWLRVSPTKNGQKQNIRMAADYLLVV